MGPYDKDSHILGSICGSFYFGKLLPILIYMGIMEKNMETTSLGVKLLGFRGS